MSYATSRGRTLIDRELYLPQSWFEDKGRCEAASIPEHISLQTKPALAKQMLQRTFEHGVKPAWVVGDEVYSCFSLRSWLEAQAQAYVFAVASNCSVAQGWKQHKVRAVLNTVPENQWEKLSVGQGTKGNRYYEWARVKINSESPRGWSRWLVFRRSAKKSEGVPFYLAFSPNTASLGRDGMCCRESLDD